MTLLEEYSNCPDLRRELEHVRLAMGKDYDPHAKGLSGEVIRRSATTTTSASRPWAVANRLSNDQVNDLVARFDAGQMGKVLAKEFGISLSSFWRLVRKIKDQGSNGRRPG